MISKSFAPLAIALVFVSMPAAFAQASGSNQAARRAERESMMMTPAQAALTTTLDAAKVTKGAAFQLKLSQKVQLQNGPELPAGTMLSGKVVADGLNPDGTTRLALRLTEADLKNGQRVAVKATIVGVFAPETFSEEGSPIVPGEQVPNAWHSGTVAVDQIGAAKDVDLHSSVASRDSGVFVTAKQEDVKLEEGSEFALAIAPVPAKRATTTVAMK